MTAAGAGGFRPDIEGLRALAILMVVVHHAGLGLAGGFSGVDVFFVVSGYLISSQLLREQARSGHRGGRRLAPGSLLFRNRRQCQQT